VVGFWGLGGNGKKEREMEKKREKEYEMKESTTKKTKNQDDGTLQPQKRPARRSLQK
jgi:hypothetical protein